MERLLKDLRSRFRRRLADGATCALVVLLVATGSPATALSPKRAAAARIFPPKKAVMPKHAATIKRVPATHSVRLARVKPRLAVSPRVRPAQAAAHAVAHGARGTAAVGAAAVMPRAATLAAAPAAVSVHGLSGNPWLALLKMRGGPILPPSRPSRSTSSRMPDLRAYEPVAVEVQRMRDADPHLLALIAALRASVAKNDIASVAAALSPDVKVIECDGDVTRPCPGSGGSAARRLRLAKLEPEQRLLQSLCCSDMRPGDIPSRLRRDAVFDLLAAALERGTLGINPDVPDAVCSPAQPLFDRNKALAMAAAADTEPANLRLASKELVVRAQPAPDAPEAGHIAAGFLVPIVTDLPKPLPDGWSAIALPQGTLAYAELQATDDLVAASSACFRKDDAGGWKIIGVVRRHQWGGLG